MSKLNVNAAEWKPSFSTKPVATVAPIISVVNNDQSTVSAAPAIVPTISFTANTAAPTIRSDVQAGTPSFASPDIAANVAPLLASSLSAPALKVCTTLVFIIFDSEKCYCY